MNFFKKLKWILGIIMVFVLILATNLIDRNNFTKVRDSVFAIYEDRLVAKELIFEMSTSIQEKELAAALSDSDFFLNKNNQINKKIQGLVVKFESTKLTFEEGNVFGEFKENLKLLNTTETNLISSNFEKKSVYLKQISNLKENFHDLSKIQMSEGRIQMLKTKKAVASVELFTHIEIYVLILLAIIVQIIVIYTPKED